MDDPLTKVIAAAGLDFPGFDNSGASGTFSVLSPNDQFSDYADDDELNRAVSSIRSHVPSEADDALSGDGSFATEESSMDVHGFGMQPPFFAGNPGFPGMLLPQNPHVQASSAPGVNAMPVSTSPSSDTNLVWSTSTHSSPLATYNFPAYPMVQQPRFPGHPAMFMAPMFSNQMPYFPQPSQAQPFAGQMLPFGAPGPSLVPTSGNAPATTTVVTQHVGPPGSTGGPIGQTSAPPPRPMPQLQALPPVVPPGPSGTLPSVVGVTPPSSLPLQPVSSLGSGSHPPVLPAPTSSGNTAPASSTPVSSAAATVAALKFLDPEIEKLYELWAPKVDHGPRVSDDAVEILKEMFHPCGKADNMNFWWTDVWARGLLEAFPDPENTPIGAAPEPNDWMKDFVKVSWPTAELLKKKGQIDKEKWKSLLDEHVVVRDQDYVLMQKYLRALANALAPYLAQVLDPRDPSYPVKKKEQERAVCGSAIIGILEQMLYTFRKKSWRHTMWGAFVYLGLVRTESYFSGKFLFPEDLSQEEHLNKLEEARNMYHKVMNSKKFATGFVKPQKGVPNPGIAHKQDGGKRPNRGRGGKTPRGAKRGRGGFNPNQQYQQAMNFGYPGSQNYGYNFNQGLLPSPAMGMPNNGAFLGQHPAQVYYQTNQQGQGRGRGRRKTQPKSN